jgi:1-acyl-sn-glycerol-3-phosphate acyltransferase
MKARDGTSMSQHRKHAPPAWRPDASLATDEPEPLPAVYAGLKRILPPLLRRFFAFRVSGLEHLPAGGPYIVAANHANYLDGVVLAVALPRKISFVVMPRVYRATPLHPYFHDHVGSIPVSLARPDPGAIRRALRVLEQGGVIGIFPEGPFSRHGRLVRGQPGVALVALRSGVPVVPAAISGTFHALAARRFFVPRRVPLGVRFGTPLRFPMPRRRLTQGLRADVTGWIMEEIAALLAADGSTSPTGVAR